MKMLERTINPLDADLPQSEKGTPMDMISKYKKNFSLCDEIGECPNITIDTELIDKFPFFIHPCPITEYNKPIMNWQM